MREDFFDALSGYFFDTPLVSHDAGDKKDFIFDSKDKAMKKAKQIGLTSVHSQKTEDGETMWRPGKNMEEFQAWLDKHQSERDTEQAAYRYENPKTGEVFTYTRKGIYRKDGTVLIYKGKANGTHEKD